mmetsp:Transcript_16285/g.31789  ORF Transcript_16285/g.31789 Transcript_16285/m.31789 type:complete len:281 (-) Transcript_16285:8-850(-)
MFLCTSDETSVLHLLERETEPKQDEKRWQRMLVPPSAERFSPCHASSTCIRHSSEFRQIRIRLVVLSLLVRVGRLAKGERVLEHAKPRHGVEGLPLLRQPWALPLEVGSLWVGHHGEVAAVVGAEGGDAVGRAVRVEGIGGGDGAVVVDVAKRCELLLEHIVEHWLVRDVRLALAVRDPHAEGRALHPTQQDRRARLDHHRDPARLVAARGVVDEARLVLLRQHLRRRHPPHERHELAAVADTERKSVAASLERVELRLDRRVVLDDARPALRRIEYICV